MAGCDTILVAFLSHIICENMFRHKKRQKLIFFPFISVLWVFHNCRMKNLDYFLEPYGGNIFIGISREIFVFHLGLDV